MTPLFLIGVLIDSSTHVANTVAFGPTHVLFSQVIYLVCVGKGAEPEYPTPESYRESHGPNELFVKLGPQLYVNMVSM